MTEFTVHTEASAPEGAKEQLADAKESMGMVPNLFGVMAEAPEVLQAYQQLQERFTSGSLSRDEVNVVWLTINVENACHYCVPAHTAIAKSMDVSDEIIEALRNEDALPDDRLEALRAFTLRVMRTQGNPSEQDLKAFFDAGYGRQQVLEVVLGLAQKTLSNYINHIAETPLDEAFQKYEWKK